LLQLLLDNEFIELQDASQLAFSFNIECTIQTCESDPDTGKPKPQIQLRGGGNVPLLGASAD